MGGPRDPHWQCSSCPFEHNWACRLRCLQCNQPAPQHIAQKAIREDKLAKDAAKSGGAHQPAAGGKEKQLREELARSNAEIARLKAAAKESGSGDKEKD